ncbi:dolichyl-phosphate-mannose-protein mannosyltransferase [Streptomyces sp. 1114.5]|uniref:ArnT family glycosyltransferase n=1 Tax=unclassified Streptomyces TaxID=2593676 RepID=UPI000BD967F2|nr:MULTISPECIES: glycosyltransferase family 39 protein [unclassified Streptomyces]RKT12186.1 dolichyl-phosphate-mannose-protein mannosyltransferase [Streptomyces sp. 1114.5]SOB79713.1 Dolichyl-phosphate-mannose-protein mannosyltransferase [Streptomyces sp. 1331.2]
MLYRRPLLAVSAGLGVVLMALSGRNGYHVDELYNRASGGHLALGYVDQPPLVSVIAKLETTLFGDTLVGFRVVPALMACLVVWVAGLTARELGGARGAQLFAAAASGATVVTLNAGHVLTTNIPDLLTWVALGWLFIRLQRTRDTRLWLAIGTVAGVGLLAKNLVVLLVLSLLVGLLVAGPRAVLRSRHLWLGAAIAAVFAVPMVLWQISHGWPAVEMSDALKVALGDDSRVAFVPFQVILIGLFLTPVWVAGLVALLRRPAWRDFRFVGVGYLFLVVLLLAIGGKPEYTGGLPLVLLAAGSVATVDWAKTRVRRSLAGTALVANLVLSSVLMLPVLPIAVYGSNPVLKSLGVFQLDQSRWPQLAEEVAAVNRSLSPQDREHAVVYANHYGLAGALDKFGPQNGLPQVYSGHNSYADFGTPGDDKNVVIAVGVNRDQFSALFESCDSVGKFETDLPVADKDTPFLVCHNPREPWAKLWPKLTWIGFSCPYTAEAITAKSEKGCSLTD